MGMWWWWRCFICSGDIKFINMTTPSQKWPTIAKEFVYKWKSLRGHTNNLNNVPLESRNWKIGEVVLNSCDTQMEVLEGIFYKSRWFCICIFGYLLLLPLSCKQTKTHLAWVNEREKKDIVHTRLWNNELNHSLPLFECTWNGQRNEK